MKQIKRFLSLALALVLVLGMVPATVFAADTTPALPTATVSEITKDDLTFAMNFNANSVTEEQLAYYGNWYADFELTVNKKVTFNNDGSADGWLAGQYDEWSKEWVTVPFGNYAPVILEANETVKIMAFAAEHMNKPGLKYTFREVYETVKNFDCGVYFDDEFLLANPDLVVTLELKMYNPENKSENYVIGETYTYTNPIVAINTTTNKAYTSLSEATLDCAANQTVVLLKDVTESVLYVLEDAILNLNGNTVVARYVSCFGDIIDSSTNNDGLLTVPANRFLIQEDNAQLPVHNGNGYKFAEIYKFEAAYRKDLGKFGLRPYIEANMLELLKQGSEATGVTVQVKITWKQDHGYRTQNFVYNDQQLLMFLNSYNASTQGYDKLFTLTVNGAEDYEELTFTAMVVSGTDVVVTPESIQNQKPVITLPADLTATYGQTLADVALPDGFMWKNNGMSVGAVGTNSFAALHTATNTEVMVPVTVAKADPDCTVPTGLTATYGQTLADVILPDGFAWVDASASVGSAGANIFAAVFTPADTDNYNTVEVEITVAVGKIDPEYTIPTGLTATYGQTLADVTLPEGFAWKNAAASVGNAGVNTFVAIFTPTDTDNYNTVEVEVAVAVAKADPSYTVPTGLTATYGQTLADVALPEGFAWVDASASVGNAGANSFTAVFTPADTANYNSIEVEVSVAVAKADPSYTVPTGLTATYGQTLADVILPDGFAWKNAAASVGNAGVNTFVAVFTPADSNYNAVEVEIAVAVAKIEPDYTIPTGLTATYGQTLAVIALPDGFTWTDPSALVGNVGTNSFAAIYTPADTDNYNSVEVVISIKVNEANPDYTVPTGLTATYGQTLAGVALPNGFAWKDASASVGNAGVNTFVAVFTPADTLNYNTVEVEVAVTVAKADPSYTVPAGLNATYGETLAGVALPNGFAWKDASASVGNAGVNTFVAVFTPADTLNYNTVEVEVAVTVAKADPSYTIPTDLTATYGQTLAGVALPNGFAWKDASASVGNAGVNTFVAVFTPADTLNYNTVEVEVAVTVAKADPSYTVPTGLTATYGQTLAVIALPNGFAWKDASASVGNAGVNTFVAVFTPADTLNYNTVEVEVAVTVAKADPSYTVPTGLTANYGETLADVTLPEGFTWKDATASVGNVGTNTFIAIFTPADTDNYNTVEVSVVIEVIRVEEEKFESKFTGDFLYRVGNQNAVSLGSLFKAKAGASIGTVSVTIKSITGASGAYTVNTTDWTKGTIRFSGTGVVKVIITDNNNCIPTELILEVVDAVNATSATSATSNNVVLLNDIGSGFTVSGDYTFYGNGFTLNYTANGQYLRNGLTHGIIEISENGTLDNLRIKATIYPKAYLYYGSNPYGEAAQDGPSDGNERYYYQLSAVAAYGDATISNCYIYGGRNNIYASTGNITITDTILECGVVSNLQIQSTNEYTVTLNNVTTIQKQVNPTIGDTGLVMLGAGVLVGPETSSNPTIVLNGSFKQYNWVTAADKSAVSDTMAQAIIGGALDATAYNHTINGVTASNLGIIYMNTHNASVVNNTGLPYEHANVTLRITSVNQSITGRAYSLQSATEDQIYSDIENADRNTVNGDYLPKLDFDLGDQEISYDGSDDTRYLYGDANGVTALYQDGDAPLTLDLTKLATIYKYTGRNYAVTVVCKDANGNALTATNGVVTLSAQGNYTLVFTVEDNIFYDKDGNAVTKSVSYTYTVPLDLTVKEASVKNAVVNITKTALDGVYTTVNVNDYKLRIDFLNCISITDYDKTGTGTTVNLSSNISSATLTPASVNVYTTAFTVTITYTDGRVLIVNFSKISGSSPGSPKTATVNTSGGVYIITDSALDNKPTESSNQNKCTITSVSFKGNNGSTVTNDTDVAVTWELGSSSGGGCVTPDTLITLADGTQVRVDSLTGDELLLVWNLETGKLDYAPIMFIDSDPAMKLEIIHLHFSDGTEVKAIYEHGFWDYDLNKYVYLDENASDYIGHWFAKQNGDELEKVQLVDVVIEEAISMAYSPVTVGHLCYFVNGMLSMPGGVGGLFNIFDVDSETMTYDYEAMERDVENYGLFTYEEMNAIVPLPEDMFIAAGGAYLKISIGKGNMTMDDLVYMIQRYTKFFPA